jgi:hypothetical protein
MATYAAVSLASLTFVAAAAGPAGAADRNIQQQQPISQSIVVGQVATQGPGGRFDEFLTIENIGQTPVNIAGYTVSACTALNMLVSLATVQTATQPPEPGAPLEPVLLAPGEQWVIVNASGYTRGLIPNQAYVSDVISPTLVEIQSHGGVLLRAAAPPGFPMGVYVDAVGFSTGLQCTETAPARPQLNFADQANLRFGIDTNVNRRDFVLYGPVTRSPDKTR